MSKNVLPLHPILVSFPTALWIFAFACDIISLMDRENSLWPSVAFYALAAGVIAGVATGLPELFDYMALRDPLPRRIARRQLGVNFIALAIFALGVTARLTDVLGLVVPVGITAIGIVFLIFAGRLGGDPAYVRGTIVDGKASGA